MLMGFFTRMMSSSSYKISGSLEFFDFLMSFLNFSIVSSAKNNFISSPSLKISSGLAFFPLTTMFFFLKFLYIKERGAFSK